MEENKFEKQVRQKMGELKLNPSEPVWENVKKRIEKRRTKKWELFIFFLLFVLLLSGAYLLFNNSGELTPSSHKIANHIKKQPGDSASNKDRVFEETNKANDLLFERKNVSKPQAVANNNKEIIKPVSRNIAKKIITTRQSKSRIIVAISNPQTDIAESLVKPGEELESKQVIDATVNSNIKIEVTSSIKEVTSSIKNDDARIDSVDKNVSANNDISKELAKPKDTVAFKEGKKSENHLSKNKWNIGILISAGISHIGNQFLGLGYTPTDYSRDQLNNGSTGGGVIITNPSKVKNSVGYITGIFLEKNISSKTKISFGINYKVFSTSNLVGPKNDSADTYKAINASGPVNATASYYNHFRFIEFPVCLSMQLTKNKSFPLFWNLGISLTQMISSDALQFDPYKGEYFKRNSFFNKTQLGLSTGVSASFFNRQKFPVTFGPYFYYSVSSLSNTGLYDKKHLVCFGLEGRIKISK
ncbi:MAG: hypothetical protein ABJA90_03230 [Ginsengibacter sp.]